MSNLEISRAERLDQYVAKQFPLLSRSSAAKLVDDGKVSVNGETVTKGGYKIRPTDLIKIDFDPEAQPAIPEIELPIIYEDDDCVVINKPVGILSHSKGEFNPEATVATWLAARVNGLTGERAGIVHRLDRATSGVMIGAKNQAALSWLQKQFSTRKAKKTYLAIVQGSLANDQAIIDIPIERNPRQPQTFRVGSNGKSAVTEYQVLKTGKDGLSLLELRPQTGRTHQLRVHLSHLDHPILGDTLYGGHPAARMFLHAKSLEITLPSRERLTFTAPEPDEFEAQLNG